MWNGHRREESQGRKSAWAVGLAGCRIDFAVNESEVDDAFKLAGLFFEIKGKIIGLSVSRVVKMDQVDLAVLDPLLNLIGPVGLVEFLYRGLQGFVKI